MTTGTLTGITIGSEPEALDITDELAPQCGLPAETTPTTAWPPEAIRAALAEIDRVVQDAANATTYASDHGIRTGAEVRADRPDGAGPKGFVAVSATARDDEDGAGVRTEELTVQVGLPPTGEGSEAPWTDAVERLRRLLPQPTQLAAKLPYDGWTDEPDVIRGLLADRATGAETQDLWLRLDGAEPQGETRDHFLHLEPEDEAWTLRLWWVRRPGPEDTADTRIDWLQDRLHEGRHAIERIAESGRGGRNTGRTDE